jgi:hypothetical protein
MLQWLLLTSALSISPGQTPGAPIDVATLKISAPAIVAELDLGALKGELRQVGWSPDGDEFYVLTVDGNGPSERSRHYIVTAAGGTPKSVDAAPEWAKAYWSVKSDRFAPGIGSLMIGFEQKSEKMKFGTGSGRPGEAVSASPGSNPSVPVDIEKTTEGQYQNFARLTLLGETISEFVNQMPIPGLMFSWGPSGSGAIAYTDRESGHLMLLDQHKHKQTVSGVKDALLPAWSTDGARLAWVRKSGRKKYTLVWAEVSKG